MNRTMKYFLQTLTLLVMLASSSVFASPLSDAKAAGLIGEKTNGYLGLVTQANDEIKALVKEVNQKRRAKYIQLAKKKQVPLSQIETIAGKKAIEKTLVGNYIQTASGQWQKKQE